MPESDIALLRDFLVPDLGEGLEEATIVEWLVRAGDEVALNQPLCVLETAKAEVEIPSPFAGRVEQLGGEPNETLQVGTLLARIEVVPEPAQPASVRNPTLVGYGADSSHDRSRRSGSATGAPPRRTDETRGDAVAGKPLAKPPVRKLARSLRVDLAAVSPGSGPGGAVTRADVQAAAEAGPADREVRRPVEGGEGGPPVDVIPVRGVRLRIAERMALSRARIPDATCAVTADFSRLLALRVDLKRAAGEDDAHLITPFALVCRLLVHSLQSHSILNATYVEDASEIRVHRAVHLGVATDTERGLVVPVVRSAQRLSTIELAREIARLADAARAGRLPPADLQSSTFTISNFGALGLDEGIPVINHPEAAILGLGSVKLRPWVDDQETVVARPSGTLTLAFDHRVCDGADAAGLLRDVRELIEHPEILMLRS